MPDNAPTISSQKTELQTIDFNSMVRAVVENPSFDPTVLQAVLTMQVAWQDRMGQDALNRAMAAAQSEVLPVIRDRANTHLRTRYATLASYMEMLQPILQRHNLRVGFDAGALPGEQVIAEGCLRVRIVIGLGGYTEKASYIDQPIARLGSQGGKTQMTEQQAVGSAMTYAQRYLLRLKFNLTSVDDDDDGEATRNGGATDQAQAAAKQEPQKQPQAAAKPIDDAKYLSRLDTLLGATQSMEAVDGVMANEHIAAWRKGADARVQTDIAVREAGARARIKAMVDAVAAQHQPAQEISPAVADAIAIINGIADRQSLTALLNDRLWNERVLPLPFPDQDRIDEAYKARMAELPASV